MEYFGVTQHVLDEAVEPDRRTHNLMKILDTLLVQFGAVFLHQKLSEALHGAQRRAHVMRNAVGKAFQFTNCFLKFAGAVLDQLLQLKGMPADFILGG